MSLESERVRGGLIFAVSGFSIWGTAPIYWRALSHLGPAEVMAHRIVGTAIIAAIVLVFRKRIGTLIATLRTHPNVRRDLLISTLLIGANWVCFVWAIMNGHTLESSLGYYLAPLVMAWIGAILLREPITPAQFIALGCAAAGIAALLIGLRMLPWISVVLAVTWSLYGYVRKRVAIEAMEGLFVETLLWLPACLGVLFFIPTRATGAQDWMLLLFAGPYTLLPLWFYTEGARRLRFTTLGFLQYLAPTLQALVATFVFHEKVTPSHIIAFAAIWFGIAIYSFDSIARERRRAAQAGPA